jgi:hypothetical protein
LAGKHAHLRLCEQLIERKFPQCAPADLKTNCLLEIGDFFSEIAVALRLPVSLVCAQPYNVSALPTLLTGQQTALFYVPFRKKMKEVYNAR